MMMLAGLLLVLRQVPAAAAAAPPPVVQPTVSSSASVLTLRYDEVVLIRLAPNAPAPIVRLADGDVARGRPLGAGELRLRLQRFAQGETLLVVENGGESFIDYQAVLTMADGSSKPTSVCTLLPHGRPSFEHWPHPVAALTLFDFHPAPSGQAAACK